MVCGGVNVEGSAKCSLTLTHLTHTIHAADDPSGVGPITALAFVLVLGSTDRFGCGHQIGSYLGLIPCEDSSADRQRLGHITKQGSSLLIELSTGEAAQAAARWDPDWRRRFLPLAMRRDRRITKVAMARKLAVSLYWMWRKDSITHRLCSSVRTRESLDSSMV
jgi:transposase